MLLSDPVTSIKGVGEKKAQLLNHLGIFTVGGLIEHFPREYDDRSEVRKISDFVEDEENTFFAWVDAVPENVHIGKMAITKVKLKDDTGSINAVWYNQPYIKNAVKKDEEYIFTGEYRKRNGRREIISPEFERADGREVLGGGRIVPVYHLTSGISQKVLRSLIKMTLTEVKAQLPDFMPLSIRKKYCLCERNFAVSNIHFPENSESFFMARRRLVFEELFVLQLALFEIKGLSERSGGPVFKNNNILARTQKALGFDFTAAQKKVVKEIINDTSSKNLMNRLIQGDVGSGKTAVAMAAALMAVESGFQAALMAPTEVLASQHYESFKQFFENFGIEVYLLKGSLKKREKDMVKADIADGKVKMVIGTHAIIQKDVEFDNLGLVITDEQHRFGVNQRNILSQKAENAHVIVMTATPIPRTLALILYGDLDISVIDELPPGRQHIQTYAVNSSYHSRAYAFVRKEVEKGRQAYMVCPMIEESDTIEAKAVDTMIKEVSQTEFEGLNVSVLHGKMKPDEKESVMRDFAEGRIQILISTTVIEVGINVPNATIMLIENAERFGLSQLHQLRGRVGRGKHQSYCILVTDSKSEQTRERMKVMKKTNDGFEISETDLKLRGPGEFFGTRQHGVPQLKIANLYKDSEILKEAQEAAKKLNKDNVWRENIDYEPLFRRVRELFLQGGRIGI
ncbi:ATP-dependent DNA helicase RecG [Lachnospiraceae bacterium NSJ-143]|nr:ATP-dependent DNA helicase RecG [Lachnospiraceae bacterium NSJ-143]